MDRVDQVMAVILKAGALTLRELFTRLGKGPDTANQLAHLIKNGDVRMDPVDGRWDPLLELGLKPTDSEEQIGSRFAQVSEEEIAERIELLPTAKAWRTPFAAA